MLWSIGRHVEENMQIADATADQGAMPNKAWHLVNSAAQCVQCNNRLGDI